MDFCGECLAFPCERVKEEMFGTVNIFAFLKGYKKLGVGVR